MLYLTNPHFGKPTEHSAIAPQWSTVYRILLLHARSFDNDAPIGKWKRRGGVYLNLALPCLKVSHQWLSSQDSVITVNDANFPLSRDPVTSSLSYKLSTGEDQFASSAFLLVRSYTHKVETLTTSSTRYFHKFSTSYEIELHSSISNIQSTVYRLEQSKQRWALLFGVVYFVLSFSWSLLRNFDFHSSLWYTYISKNYITLYYSI